MNPDLVFFAKFGAAVSLFIHAMESGLKASGVVRQSFYSVGNEWMWVLGVPVFLLAAVLIIAMKVQP
jgi:hypothetical protein